MDSFIIYSNKGHLNDIDKTISRSIIFIYFPHDSSMEHHLIRYVSIKDT